MKNTHLHIRISEELKKKASKKAEEGFTTLTQVVTDLLAKWIKK